MGTAHIEAAGLSGRLSGGKEGEGGGGGKELLLLCAPTPTNQTTSESGSECGKTRAEKKKRAKATIEAPASGKSLGAAGWEGWSPAIWRGLTTVPEVDAVQFCLFGTDGAKSCGLSRNKSTEHGERGRGIARGHTKKRDFFFFYHFPQQRTQDRPRSVAHDTGRAVYALARLRYGANATRTSGVAPRCFCALRVETQPMF